MLKKVIKAFLIIATLQLSLQAREINIDKLINSAKESKKHLLIWLHKTECGYCENMREFTLGNETIKSFIDKNFIFEHINISEKDNVKYKGFISNGRRFAQAVGYDFYPTSIFFDGDGEVVLIEVGYLDRNAEPNEERFFKILNFINSKSYETIEFKDYIFNIKREL